MTISTVIRRAETVGNGATTVFPHAFFVNDENDLEVYLYTIATDTSVLVSSSAYTVAGVGTASGSITYNPGSPIPSTQKVITLRTVAYTQELNVSNQSGILLENIELQLDLLVMQIQQNADKPSKPTNPLTGYMTQFDDNGDLINGIDATTFATDIASVVSSASAASASAIAAALSETNAALSAITVAASAWNFLGAYNAGTAYVLNDVVVEAGSSWINIQAGTGQLPSSNPAYWTKIAAKGTDGLGAGDMTVAVYDPDAVGASAFAMGNMIEDATSKIFTNSERTKLSGIETAATTDQTGAEIKIAYEGQANAFTDAQFTKLATIETNATADQTGAEIKTAYQAQTNAFTDAQFTKLAGIATGATVGVVAQNTSRTGSIVEYGPISQATPETVDVATGYVMVGMRLDGSFEYYLRGSLIKNTA